MSRKSRCHNKAEINNFFDATPGQLAFFSYGKTSVKNVSIANRADTELFRGLLYMVMVLIFTKYDVVRAFMSSRNKKEKAPNMIDA